MAATVESPPAAPVPERVASTIVVDPAARRFIRGFGGAKPPPPPRAGWRYAATDRRDLRIDLLRGFAVLAMVIDHIGGSSWLYALTGGNRFFVSAAEAFVFISGLTVGIVYGDRARRDGLRAAAGKLLARAWTLYVLAVWLAIGTAFFAALFNLPRGLSLTGDPARFVFEVITVRRTFYLVDVMLLYTFLLALSPLVLAALARGWWWPVLIGSTALWGAYQAFPGQLHLPWKIIDNPVFNFAPWQFLFFTGLLIGHGREALAATFLARVPRPPLRDGWMALPLILFAGLVYLHVTNGAILAPLVPGGDTAAWLDFWFDKSALPLPRLLACALVFATFWLVVTRWWVPIRAALGWLLLPLGQRALYAYAAHLFLVAAIQVLILAIWEHGREVGYSTLHPGIDSAIQLAGIGVLWLLVRARFLQGVVASLGSPPFSGLRLRWRGLTVPRPADSLAALLVAALLSGLLAAPNALGLRLGGTPQQQPAGGATTGARASAPPASTVTVPRRVGGAVQGSSGLTGRSDGPTPTPQPAGVAAPRVLPTIPPRSVTPRSGAAATPAPSGKAAGGYLADVEFYSRALGRTMPYGIYIPPTYESEPNRRYPVLYMLHGGGGHYSEWVAYGLPEQAEDLYWAGEIAPMIIVMPQGDQSYWSNHTYGDEERWGDYVAQDLVAHIDATYRTIATSAGRAVGGLSMGGFGALQLAFNHPETFGTVGAHSPALHDFAQMADIFADVASFEEADPIALAAKLDPATAPEIAVDTGADDDWAERTLLLAERLDERGVAHDVRVLPGKHDADYWTSRVPDYLHYYARALAGGAATR